MCVCVCVCAFLFSFFARLAHSALFEFDLMVATNNFTIAVFLLISGRDQQNIQKIPPFMLLLFIDPSRGSNQHNMVNVFLNTSIVKTLYS